MLFSVNTPARSDSLVLEEGERSDSPRSTDPLEKMNSLCFLKYLQPGTLGRKTDIEVGTFPKLTENLQTS